MHQVTVALVLTEVETLLAALRAGKPQLPRIVTPSHTPLVNFHGDLPR
jgi:hypothetical protein